MNFKNFLIFAIGGYALKKLFSTERESCYKGPHHFYFLVDKDKKKITWQCKKADNDDFFLYTKTNGYLKPVHIDLNSDLGMLARIAYAEAENEPYWVKIGICETVRNRVLNDNSFNNEHYCHRIGFDNITTYIDAIMDGYDGIKQDKFKNPIDHIRIYDEKNNYDARKQFVYSIASALFMLNFNSNIVKGALFNSTNCNNKYYFNCHNIVRVDTSPDLPKAVTCFYTKIENTQQ